MKTFFFIPIVLLCAGLAGCANPDAKVTGPANQDAELVRYDAPRFILVDEPAFKLGVLQFKAFKTDKGFIFDSEGSPQVPPIGLNNIQAILAEKDNDTIELNIFPNMTSGDLAALMISLRSGPGAKTGKTVLLYLVRRSPGAP